MRGVTKTGALKISLFTGLSVVLIEGLAGISIGSLALMGDAGHSALDAGSALVLLIATWMSMKPADEDHTYGHGKIEFLGSLIGGIVLIVFAVGIMFEALTRVGAGNHVQAGMFGYAAASYAAVMEIVRMSVLVSVMKADSPAVRAAFYHALSDFGTTILVFVSLGLASLGYAFGDTAIAILLAMLLLYLSFRLIYSSSMELSDAISGRTVQQILSEIHKTREVIKVKELRARHVGVVTYIDAIISVSPHIGITEADVIASKIERNLLAVVGRGSIMLHLEPADFGIPVEDKLKSAADLVEGADDLHKLSVTNVDGGLYVIIHIHVNPSLTLEEADKIAEEVESNIKKADPTVKQVTVHLEPASPKRANGVIIKDKRLVEAVKDIAQSYPGVVEVDSIVVYSAEEKVRVNVHCLFEGNHNVAKVHETVSRIEEAIRRRIPNAEVTVHSEPASDQQTTKTTANEQTPS